MILYRHRNRKSACYRALVRWFGAQPLHVVIQRFRDGDTFPLLRGGRS